MKNQMILLTFLSFGIPLKAATTYEVPLDENRQDLKPFSEITMTKAKMILKDGKVQLDYELPEELTGHKVRMKFESTKDVQGASFSLDGSTGLGTCEERPLEAGIYDCEMGYNREDLQVKPVDVKKLLEKSYSDLEEITARTEVSEIFFNEARGFIRGIRLKVKQD